MKIRSHCFVVFTTLALFFTLNADANVVACPTNTKFVNDGDNISQVIAKCGPPLQQITLKPKKEKTIVIWQYMTPAYFFVTPHPSNLSVIFSNSLVSQFVAGENEFNHIPCVNGEVSLGATMRSVENACGDPYSKKTIHPHNNEIYPHEPEITKLIYKPRRYLPKTIFIFKDNSLVDHY